jgi:hypothetical protein
MQFYEVQFRAVAFVLAEAILRETGAEVAHNCVPRDLRDDTRGRDAEAVAIAINDRRLRQRKGKNREAIDEDVLRLRRQSLESGAHRLVGGAQNINRVDLDRIDHADRPENGVVRDEVVVNFFALFGQELLRIVQTPVAEFFGKNDCGGDHRAGQSAAAGFVDAGDRGDTEGAEFAFMPEATTTVHLANQPLNELANVGLAIVNSMSR